MPVSYDVGNVFLSKLLASIFVIGADSILEMNNRSRNLQEFWLFFSGETNGYKSDYRQT